MSELVIVVITALTGVAAGYLTKWAMTPRERRHDDISLLNEAINPLVESTRLLTDQNRELVSKLLDEQAARLKDIDEKRQLLSEREELQKKIDRLNKKIEELNRKIEELKGSIDDRMLREPRPNDN